MMTLAVLVSVNLMITLIQAVERNCKGVLHNHLINR